MTEKLGMVIGLLFIMSYFYIFSRRDTTRDSSARLQIPEMTTTIRLV